MTGVTRSANWTTGSCSRGRSSSGAIYIEDVYARCNQGCAVNFAPGPWNTSSLGNSNDKALAMTAWVFDEDMLPDSLRGNPSSVGQNHYVQLVKNNGF